MFSKQAAAALGIVLLISCSSGGGSAGAGPAPTAGLAANGFIPSSGQVGQLVTIAGRNFQTSALANQVLFGGAVPASIEVATANSLIVRVPIGAKTGPLVISSGGASATTSDVFHVLPVISSIVPPSATVGTVIELIGSGFNGDDPAANLVSFAGVPATVLLATPTSIMATIPIGAVTGQVLVATQDGSIAFSQPYTILPSITGVSQDYGVPGTTITISGFNFQPNLANDAVFFNGLPAAISGGDYFSLTATAPAGLTTGPISVTTPDGVAIGPTFYFADIPFIASFFPPSGPVGQPVNIQGANFVPGATVVKFNGIPAAIGAITTTSIDATVPVGAFTGPIEVSHPFGSVTSLANFVVLQPPSLASFSPASGSPGRAVTILGSNFDPVPSGNVVKFAGVAAQILNATTTQLLVRVPDGAASGPISVTTLAGTSVSASAFQMLFSRYAVAANKEDHTLSIFRMDTAARQLVAAGYFDLGAGVTPTALTASTNGSLLFVTDSPGNKIRTFSVSPAGQLTLVSTADTGVGPSAIAVHPLGQYLYVTNRSSNNISVFSIAGNGSLTLLETELTDLNPVGLAIGPSGNFLYATNSFNGPGGNSVSAYTIAADGRLTLLQRKLVGPNPRSLAISPDGKFLYSPSTEFGSIWAFQILANGKLSLINNNALTNQRPVACVIDPAGKYLFTANEAVVPNLPNTISRFQIGAAGTLTSLGQTQISAWGLNSLMIDFADNLYAVSGTDASGAPPGADEISIFSIDAGSGALASAPPVRGRSGPVSIVHLDGAVPAKPVPQFAYAVNTANVTPGGNSISCYGVAANGNLSALGAGSTPAPSLPMEMVVDPLGQFAYAIAGSGYIKNFKLSSVTPGFLDPNGSTPDPQNANTPFKIAVDPAGGFVFVANTNFALGAGVVISFRIDRLASPGALISPIVVTLPTPPPSPFAWEPSEIFALSTDPNGRFLYAMYQDGNSGAFGITAFSVDSSSGALAPIGSPLDLGFVFTTDMVVHPSGRFAYVYDANGGGQFLRFAIGGNGAFVAPPQILAASGQAHDSRERMAMDPSGRFLFLTRRVFDEVYAFQVDPASGAVTPVDADPAAPGVQGFATGDQPSSPGQIPSGLAVDPSGSLLYVANGADTPTGNSVSVFRIDGNTGFLTAVDADSLTPGVQAFAAGRQPKSVAAIARVP